MAPLMLRMIWKSGKPTTCSRPRGDQRLLTRARSALFPLLVVMLLGLLLGGCAGVKVSSISTKDYMSLRRGDVLTTGELSASTHTALQVIGMDEKSCSRDAAACRRALRETMGLDNERRLSSLSELWLQEALALGKQAGDSTHAVAMLDAYLESARHAYAYLFLTERKPNLRALEDRQTQVRDYYNFSVQQLLTTLFDLYSGRPPEKTGEQGGFQLRSGRWRVSGDMGDVRLAGGREIPNELIPASSLSFAGLRSQYRRDGLGAELVAVTSSHVVNKASAEVEWSETPFPAITGIVSFPGNNLEEVLNTCDAEIHFYDPYRRDVIDLADTRVPLAANFTSGYGLWLARSGFAAQSLLTLIGKGDVLERPRVYLMQPYDPNRRTIIMLHGLASSPEAWINVANEVLGDEVLRQNYQIWQIYYPTNVPIAFNHRDIRRAIERTLDHFDPGGTAPASRDIVLVGHSMGGILSRLLVSSSGDRLWEAFLEKHPLKGRRLERVQAKLKPYVYFEPLQGVSRAIFIASPHKGTPFAEKRLSRWAAGFVKLPVSVLGQIMDLGQLLVDPGSAAAAPFISATNSIANLSSRDPFILATAGLPISPHVTYHSIIGNNTPGVPLFDSSDGVVPYHSAHLPGAKSEKVIPSGHSVQETPEAIIEIRRILHLHLSEPE